MVPKNYNELKNALEKSGFIQIEENVDDKKFRSGKWICQGGILNIEKSKSSKGVDIMLNGSSNICTIDIDINVEPK